VTFSDPLVVCPNVEEYQRAMVAWVDYVMSQGADGIYVDMLEGRDPCWGAHCGVHKHIIPDTSSNFPKDPADPSANENQAFALLLKRVREVVKRHRPGGLIFGNSGNPLGLKTDFSHPNVEEFQQYIDGDTMEAYICHSDAKAILSSRPPGKAIRALPGIN
jgi:hypothetical protein